MANLKNMVTFHCESVSLSDLAIEVGSNPATVQARWIRAGRPADITGHDDLLAHTGKYRKVECVTINGETMTIASAARVFNVTVQTMRMKIRRNGKQLSSNQAEPHQGKKRAGEKERVYPTRKAHSKPAARFTEDRSPGWWERKHLAHVGTRKICTTLNMGSDSCTST